MSLETVVLEHAPSSYKVYLALFRNVRNSGFLHQQLLARNADFEYAFVDASTVRCFDAQRAFLGAVMCASTFLWIYTIAV